jgi:hypothetical protein
LGSLSASEAKTADVEFARNVVERVASVVNLVLNVFHSPFDVAEAKTNVRCEFLEHRYAPLKRLDPLVRSRSGRSRSARVEQRSNAERAENSKNDDQGEVAL